MITFYDSFTAKMGLSAATVTFRISDLDVLWEFSTVVDS